jgi:hypothetical protein
LLAERRARKLGCHAGGLFEGRTFRHIDDDLKLALVVEGEHLHRHQFEGDKRDRREQHRRHRPQEGIAPGPIDEDAHHEPAVQPRQAVLRPRAVVSRAPEQASGRPRGRHKRHNERKHHRGGRPDGDGPHVGPHQPAHESHGEDGRDHGQRRENRRIPDFINRADHQRGERG